MNVTKLVESYSEFLPPETLKKIIEKAVEFLPEQVDDVLPSFQVGQDGLSLSSLLLVTKKYLCELHLKQAQSICGFDIIAKNTVFNYRIKTWTHEIKEEDVVKASFELAEVELKHGSLNQFVTMLYFAGDAKDRDSWLKNVTRAIPIPIVLGYSRSIP